MQRQLSHLGRRDDDPRRIAALIQLGPDAQTGGGAGVANVVHDRFNGLPPRPRQFSVMWQNRRCWILFRLLVPGGKCDTWMQRCRSSATRCSSVFQPRDRDPLLPPASAVMKSAVAWGGRCNVHDDRQAHDSRSQ